MELLIIIFSVLIGLPILMLILFMFNLKGAKKIAEESFASLTDIQKQDIAKNDDIYRQNVFFAYFSRKSLSKVMVKNMCNKVLENKADNTTD